MQTYYAKSIFVSQTFWINLLMALVAILQSSDVITILPPKYIPLTTGFIAIANIILRLYTVRPAAIIAPGNTEAVKVESLKS
jgi:hypothetical protein